MTLPLVTQADGSKLGKTESGTVWIDSEYTSAYQFYQYWINADDRDVIGLLKFFTFLSKEEISELAATVETQPWERIAQRELARQVTTIVHGAEAATSAENISQAVFYGKVKDLSTEEIEQGLNDVPTHDLLGDQEIKVCR